jgi:hypothetical protein
LGVENEADEREESGEGSGKIIETAIIHRKGNR